MSTGSPAPPPRSPPPRSLAPADPPPPLVELGPSIAHGVNGAGTVSDRPAGHRAVDERGPVVDVEHISGTPFQWDPRTGRTSLLTDLGGGYADVWAVNDRGVAVGTSTPPDSPTSDAVVFGRAVPPPG